MSKWPKADKEKLDAHRQRSRELNATYKGIEERLLLAGMDWSVIFKDASYKDAAKAWHMHYNTCAQCGSTDNRVEDYDMMWHDGEVVCNGCDHYVRGFDAG